jgi:hypothetical protein
VLKKKQGWSNKGEMRRKKKKKKKEEEEQEEEGRQPLIGMSRFSSHWSRWIVIGPMLALAAKKLES